MEPERPEHDETGGETTGQSAQFGEDRPGEDGLGDADRPGGGEERGPGEPLSGPGPSAAGLPDAPWPRFEETEPRSRGLAGGGDPGDAELDEGMGLSALAIALLNGAIGVVTFGGIAIGKAVEPSKTTATTTTAPVAASTVQTTTTTPATPVQTHSRPVTRWGPLTVHAAARFTPSARAAAAVSGTTLVVAGGTGARVLAGPASGPLARIADLPASEAAAQAFAIGGAVYILGGEQGKSASDQVIRVDVSAGKAAAAGTFEEPLAEAGAAVSGTSAILVGGWTGQKYATAVLRYAPGGTAALVARLPEGVRSPAVAVVGDTLVVAGGLTEHGVSRQVYAIDLASGGVKALAALPEGLDRAALLAVGSKLYLFGGLDGAGKPLASIVRIDVARGEATVAGTMPRPLADAVATHAGAQALLVDTRGGVVYRVG